MSKRILLILSGIFCMTMMMDAALAEESGIVGQRFQFQGGRAAKSLLKTTVPESREDLVQKYEKNSTKYKYIPNCGREGSTDYACFETKYGIDFIPPYSTSVPYLTPAPRTLGREDYKWAPLDLVRYGNELLKELKKRAVSGEPFDCGKTFCYVIVEATSYSKPSSENWYALCRVAKVGDTIGAPQGCKQIAIESQIGTWIHVITSSYEPHQYILGLPDFTFRIHVTPTENLRSTIPSFAKKIAQFIKAPPLNLEPTMYDYDTVIATASYRASTILPGWREIVTVRVDIRYGYGEDRERCLGVVISTTLYVNRQNTTSPSDWGLPNRQQEAAYLNHIRTDVIGAIKDICSETRFKTPDDIVCEF